MIEGRRLAVEKVLEGEVDDRRLLAVEVDLHVALFGPGRPDSPDAARAFHFGHHDLVALLADAADIVAVGVPPDVRAGCLVDSARAVPTRPLGATFTRLRQDGQVSEIRHPMHEIGIGQRLLGAGGGDQDYRSTTAATANDRTKHMAISSEWWARLAGTTLAEH